MKEKKVPFYETPRITAN